MENFSASNIDMLLKDNEYPGRGIVIGKSASGKFAAVAYFIMGRSENSKNRVFEMKDGALFTAPFDKSRVKDPSLIIYPAMKKYQNKLIVTNGDQTDTILSALECGIDFKSALSVRDFEPDFPNMTPRISGLLTFLGGDFSYEMSIVKSADEKGSGSNRFTFSYHSVSGIGHLIHTYFENGSPLPSFVGEPKRAAIPDSIDEFSTSLWRGLNTENRISLFVRYIDLSNGKEDDRIFNKNLGD